jgi:hypothetical protein
MSLLTCNLICNVGLLRISFTVISTVTNLSIDKSGPHGKKNVITPETFVDN